jgi:hypothetical protein
MRLHQIKAPASHPYVANLTIDPVEWHKLERMIENSRALRLLDLDDRSADHWTVRIGCASERVRDGLEDGWA